MADPTLQEVLQAAQQAAQAANQAAQAATQSAQQIAEQVGQAVSQAIAKTLQTFTQTTGGQEITGKTIGREELGDIGGTERLEKDQMNDSGLLFANAKRTYDEYQQESLESIKRNRTYVDKVLSDALQYDNQRQVIANQSLQNAVETANMVGKQAVRHGDIAIDRQWNLDEQVWGTEAIINAIKPTLESVVAKILSDMATSQKPAA
jgi:cell wall-associated NlpC family hydrolase